MSDKDNHTVPAPDVESPAGDAALAEKGFTPLNTRVNVRVISYRRLNHDPDGVSVKAVLDGIVRRQILADDSSKQIESVTFESRKSKEERTVIEITEAL